MKNLILGLAVIISALFNAQYIEDANWANQYPTYGNYEDNQFYFPEDYYYEYPDDYYEDQYYQTMFNDYRNSIEMVNWRRFFRDHRLSRRQINLIIDLNRQFDSFYVWSNYYRMNPNRWWYDRFFALEMILGPRVFVVFQNNFYNGFSPVIYYNNYWHNNYRPRFVCRPAYRNIQVHQYRINRNHFHENVGNQYGWNQPRNANRGGNGFREDNRSGGAGVRNEQNRSGSNGIRENDRNENLGFRDENRSGNSGFRNEQNTGTHSENQTGVRNNTTKTPIRQKVITPTRGQRQPTNIREKNRSHTISRSGATNNGASRGESRSRSTEPIKNNSSQKAENDRTRATGTRSR